MIQVVLASASPRRRELLGRLIRDFEIVVSDVDEAALTVADPRETAERLALAKTEAVLAIRPDALVIGADTVVAYLEGDDYRQLGKPSDRQEAIEMLRTLSGRTHCVITGVCLARGPNLETFSETTQVTFRQISTTEAAAYVDTGEPMDKAGGYAIQGSAAKFVEHLEGSLTNVVGLPLEALSERLARLYPGLVE